jgi:hypothetical protein
VIPSPSSEANEQPPAPAGFTLPIDIVVAPGRAFVKIAQTREWIPALVVIALCGAATIALDTPPFTHITSLSKAGDIPTSSDIMYQLAFLLLIVPLLVSMLVATMVTALARWKEPAAPYGRFFSLAINCMVPSALGNVIHGAVAVLRHPTYASFRAFDTALPDSLGVFAAPGNDREFGFLAHFGIFDAWSFVLIGYGISLFAGIRFSTALFIAAALYFLYVFAYN